LGPLVGDLALAVGKLRPNFGIFENLQNSFIFKMKVTPMRV